MALRANTYSSAINFTEYFFTGLSLKSRALKRAAKEISISQKELAKELGMSKKEMLRKLYKRRKFDVFEIKNLVYLLGAKLAIQVIWFPTIQEKRRIENYVWEGQMNNTYGSEPTGTPSEKKRRAIERQNRESGEDWEGSEDCERLIFDSDELPSRRFMRRRNNG